MDSKKHANVTIQHDNRIEIRRPTGLDLYVVWNMALTALAVVAIGGTLLHLRDHYRDTSSDLANIKRLNEQLVPGIERMSDFDKAVALRNLLHTHVPVRMQSSEPDWTNIYREYRGAVLDRYEGHVCDGHICDGMQLLYMAALNAHGIRSRPVSLFIEVAGETDQPWSHASVEAFIDGKWIAIDPTFNFTLRSDGQLIGWVEAADLVGAGQPVWVDPNGHRIRPVHKNLQIAGILDKNFNFITPFLNYIAIGPFTRPKTWDGSVRFKDGRALDVTASGKATSRQ